jgi:hypothetical protein
LESEIFIVNTDGSNLKKVGARREMNLISSVFAFRKWIAFQYGKTSLVTGSELAIIPLSGSIKDKTDIHFDRNKGNLVWSKDEKYIYFTRQAMAGSLFTVLR